MNLSVSTSIIGRIFILAGISCLLQACKPVQVQQEKPLKAPVVAINYPKHEIALPGICDLTTYLPKAGIDSSLSPHKIINEQFSARERNHVGVQDPKRFSDGDTEIIDLSAIQPEDYAFPLPGAKVISPYGGRRRHHSGYDIKTKANDTIVAAFDGIVRMAKPYAAYGNVVVIRHYNGLETVYSHNSKNLVKPGDRVKAGTPVALTGRTGRATTAHLHFEVRFNGMHFNPNYVFRFKSQKLRKNILICKRRNGQITVNPIRKQDALLAPDVTK